MTLPNTKWGLLYGIILCNARAMDEFGAVYVVSGRITGQADTLPLRVEKLFQEYDLHGAFVAASLLCFLAVVTLFVKTALEWKTRRELAGRNVESGAESLADSIGWTPVLSPALAGAGLGLGASLPSLPAPVDDGVRRALPSSSGSARRVNERNRGYRSLPSREAGNGRATVFRSQENSG